MTNKSRTHLTTFSDDLLEWAKRHGRHQLPWQNPLTPYRVWVSEIMLQQTQVTTVKAYFIKFMSHFPNLESLANAHIEEVLAVWSGLGYYSRAKNLHKAAKALLEHHDGAFPKTIDALSALPGIGKTTACAISSLSFNQPDAILDGNVKRILCRIYNLHEWPGTAKVQQKLWSLAQSLMPKKDCQQYTQAIMDLGALVCKPKSPLCAQCPVQSWCKSFELGQQATLPIKKPAKPKPTYAIYLLLLFNQKQQLLLEKRPDTGVWAKLWSLPQLNRNQQTNDIFFQEFKTNLEGLKSIKQFKHSFSHYHLDVVLKSIELPESLTKQIVMENRKWVELSALNGIGTPSIVNKCIKFNELSKKKPDPLLANHHY